MSPDDLKIRAGQLRSKIRRLEMGVGRARTLLKRHPNSAEHRQVLDFQMRALKAAEEELRALQDRAQQRPHAGTRQQQSGRRAQAVERHDAGRNRQQNAGGRRPQHTQSQDRSAPGHSGSPSPFGADRTTGAPL